MRSRVNAHCLKISSELGGRGSLCWLWDADSGAICAAPAGGTPRHWVRVVPVERRGARRPLCTRGQATARVNLSSPLLRFQRRRDGYASGGGMAPR